MMARQLDALNWIVPRDDADLKATAMQNLRAALGKCREKLRAPREVRDKVRCKRRAAYSAAYRTANREKLNAKNAAYYAENAERVNARITAYRAANAESVKAWNAAYHAANREKAKEYNAANREKTREYRSANAGKLKKRFAAWCAANPEKLLARTHAYRARKRGAEGKQNQNTDKPQDRSGQAMTTAVCCCVGRQIKIQRQRLGRNLRK